MDPLNLFRDAELLYSSGIKKFHFDVMDGSFVPRYGLYPEILHELLQKFELEADCHFMVANVLQAVEEWTSYTTPHKISFHFNSHKHNLADIVQSIRSVGSKAIIAFDLDVPANQIADIVNESYCDGIMMLSIRPGVLRQKPDPEATISKLISLREIVDLKNVEYIQADGGVNFETIPKFIQAGCNELICGSATLFNIPKTLPSHERPGSILTNINNLKVAIRCA
jgi:ribulose-phosphate 3-epimerase